MNTTKTQMITVEALINAPVEKVWKFWTQPEHITQWCNASDDWHAPRAENDVRTGGKFDPHGKKMEVWDLTGGIYDDVKLNEKIDYTMGDGRKVHITFIPDGNSTKVLESFDPESMNPHDAMQRMAGNPEQFQKYTETRG